MKCYKMAIAKKNTDPLEFETYPLFESCIIDAYYSCRALIENVLESKFEDYAIIIECESESLRLNFDVTDPRYFA